MTCAVCYGEGWVRIERGATCRFYQCPACCFFPPLKRPWAWETDAQGGS